MPSHHELKVLTHNNVFEWWFKDGRVKVWIFKIILKGDFFLCKIYQIFTQLIFININTFKYFLFSFLSNIFIHIYDRENCHMSIMGQIFFCQSLFNVYNYIIIYIICEGKLFYVKITFQNRDISYLYLIVIYIKITFFWLLHSSNF